MAVMGEANVDAATVERDCCRTIKVGQRVVRVDGAVIGAVASHWFEVKRIEHDGETGDFILYGGTLGIEGNAKDLHLRKNHYRQPIGRKQEFNE